MHWKIEDICRCVDDSLHCLGETFRRREDLNHPIEDSFRRVEALFRHVEDIFRPRKTASTLRNRSSHRWNGGSTDRLNIDKSRCLSSTIFC